MFFNPIKQFLLLKIKQKDIFGINFGVNFSAQICALKIGINYAKKWLYYDKISFIG
jgi:hypothetical protein